MAKVILESGDTYVAASPVTIYGSTGNETVKVQDGVLVTTNSSVERVEFGKASTAYVYKTTPTGIQVLLGTTPVANLANNQKLSFTDGSATVSIVLENGALVTKLGGVVVPATAGAVAFTPNNAAGEASTVTTTPTTPSAGQTFSLTNSATADAPVMTAGNDTVTGALGTIADTDRIIDNSSTDSDIFNATLNESASWKKPQVINVEALNVTGEYTNTGFDFANSVGIKTTTYSAGITGATATSNSVTATRVAEIVAGTNIGTLTVNTDAGGTGGTVKVNTGSATTIVVGGSGSSVAVTGNDVYDITLGSAATSLTLEANANGGSQSTADDFKVKLAGNTALALNADNGEIETLTLNSTGAANTVTLTGDLVAKGTNYKAVITGDKNLTLVANVVNIDNAAIEDSSTGVFTVKTSAAIGTDAKLNKAAIDVLQIANAFSAANTVTVNDATTVKLSVDLGKTTTWQVQNAASTLSTTNLGTLNVDVAVTQGNVFTTSTQVGTLKLSTASATDAVALNDLSVAANTDTVTISGSKNLEIKKLIAADDNTVVSAVGYTGKLTLSDTAGNKFVVVGGENNDTIKLDNAKADSVARGGNGDDTISTSTNKAIMYGDAGNDTITGSTGVDTISGGEGNDLIDGKGGADVISLGAGADKVVLFADNTAANVASISDFAAGTDKLVLASTNTSATTQFLDLTVLSAANQTTVNNEASAAAAVEKVMLNTGSGYTGKANEVILFQYKTDTYAFINVDGNAEAASYLDATDYLVKLTGVTGTLSAADFLVS